MGLCLKTIINRYLSQTTKSVSISLHIYIHKYIYIEKKRQREDISYIVKKRVS